MPKVTLSGYILVPEDDLAVVSKELVVHTQLTLEEPGCLAFQVNKHPEIFNRFDVYEKFIDKAAFAYHQARVKSSIWGQVTVNVERFYEITTQLRV